MRVRPVQLSVVSPNLRQLQERGPIPIEISGISNASWLTKACSHSSISVGGSIISESMKRTATEDDCLKPIFLASLRFAALRITVAPLRLAISMVPSLLQLSTKITSHWEVWLLTEAKQRPIVRDESNVGMTTVMLANRGPISRYWMTSQSMIDEVPKIFGRSVPRMIIRPFPCTLRHAAPG